MYTNFCFSVLHDRKSFEFEDLAGSTSLLFSRSMSQEHHYEDILGQTPPLSITDVNFKEIVCHFGEYACSLSYQELDEKIDTRVMFVW